MSGHRLARPAKNAPSVPSAGTGPDPVRGRIRIRCRQSSPRDGNRCRGAVIRKLSGSWIHAPTADHRAPKGVLPAPRASSSLQRKGSGDRGSSGRLHCCSCRLVQRSYQGSCIGSVLLFLDRSSRVSSSAFVTCNTFLPSVAFRCVPLQRKSWSPARPGGPAGPGRRRRKSSSRCST